MRTTLFAAAIVCIAGSAASAQVDENAKAKLQAMSDTVKNLQSLSYSVVNKGAGGFFEMLPEHRAQVTMLRDPQTQEWKMRITGTRGAAMNDPALDFIVVQNGNYRSWIDDEAKTVYERPKWNANSQHTTAADQSAFREFTEPVPFQRNLQASTIKFEQPTVVEGTPVDVVLADPGQNQPMYRFYIAADNLPRKIEYDAGGMGKTAWTLSGIATNASIAEHAFQIDTPEGYTLSAAPKPVAPSARPQQGSPGAGNDSGDAGEVPAKPQRTIGTEVGNLAPDFTLKNAAGEDVTLSALRGNVVLLDYWGTWCIPCKKASPGLQAMTEKYKEDPFKLYGLAVREQSDDKPIAYMKENNYTYGLLLKGDDVARTYKVRVYPSYFVIDKEGVITFITTGYDEETIPQLEEAVEIALGKRKPKPKAPAPAPAPAAKPAAPKPAPAPDDTRPNTPRRPAPGTQSDDAPR